MLADSSCEVLVQFMGGVVSNNIFFFLDLWQRFCCSLGNYILFELEGFLCL